jgi:2-keto-3-deoxy-L-rhamnonate aldolase RhmA
MNGLLERLGAPGACLLGTWVKLRALESLELLAIAGFDFVVVDMEHAPHTFESAYQCIVGAQGFGMKALVRLPDAQGSYIQRILDAGADGVLVPRVTTPSEVSQQLQAMVFSPRGTRGMGITSRAGQWGLRSVADYIAQGDGGVFRGVQFEDQQALRQAEEILAVEGVNAAFVGPGDLSMSSGLPASHPDNAALVDHLLGVCRARGIPCGTAVADAEAARHARQRGFRFVMVSNDLSLLGRAARQTVQLARG